MPNSSCLSSYSMRPKKTIRIGHKKIGIKSKHFRLHMGWFPRGSALSRFLCFSTVSFSQNNVGEESTVAYFADYLAEFNPVTAECELQKLLRIMGKVELPTFTSN